VREARFPFLVNDEQEYFADGAAHFITFDTVTGTNDGLSPTFNSNSCGSCHAQPATGGSSPALNRRSRRPVADGTLSATVDGGVHDLFTISGRADAPGCEIAQPNFAQAEELNNIIFRIPTPLFGVGLIENIPDATIYANLAANAALKQSLGISGHPNVSGNDGTITRFGWKAQNKSVEMFAGEAYNVEMGVTNELFPDERGLPPA
jgi:CxxC motif-containing protein (DUF1111 family)